MANDLDWEAAHRDLVRIAVGRAALEPELIGALRRALHAEAWRAMGMATFIEYAERFVGLSPRQTEERLRVGQASVPRRDGELQIAALREARADAEVRRQPAALEHAERRAGARRALGQHAVEVVERDLVRRRGRGQETARLEHA